MPCKKELAHLVQMRSKYADQGLVIITVELYIADDDTADKRKHAQEKSLAFLRRIKGDFVNVVLEEPWEFWEKKLGEPGTPILYVFNRRNQIEVKYNDAAKAEQELDRLVPELLKK